MSEPRIFLDGRVTLHAGDCREVLRGMADNSIDSVVCDPPYHLQSIVKRFAKVGRTDKTWSRSGPHQRTAGGFMNKLWDGGDIAFQPDLWAEVLRVLKPGGYIMAFSGCRTYHHMACAIEDAGFITHPFFAWAFGSGFPKAHNLSKQLDRMAGRIGHCVEDIKQLIRMRFERSGLTLSEFNKECGFEASGYLRDSSSWASVLPTPEKWIKIKKVLSCDDGGLDSMFEAAEREVIGNDTKARSTSGKSALPTGNGSTVYETLDITAPATDAAREWDGWFYGTQACKPSVEPVFCGQKPFTNQQYVGIIGSCLTSLWRQLWSILPASVAEQNSHLRPITRDEAKDISAQKNVYIKEDSFAQMDMSQLESAMISSLNTVSSWSGIWVECSAHENMSIIETELSTITTLATLSCLVSKITPESIIQDHNDGAGLIVNASHAALFFNGFVARLKITLELSALANVIAKEATNFQGAPANTPNIEPVYFGQKPFERGLNGAQNILKWGVGAINVGGCKVQAQDAVPKFTSRGEDSENCYGNGLGGSNRNGDNETSRWPANLIHDGSDEVLACFPETKTNPGSGEYQYGLQNCYGDYKHKSVNHGGDSGSAARFFARFPQEDVQRIFYTSKADADDRLGSRHPTVKPISMIQYLVRLITPKNGVCLDLFAGTGTTAEACFREGFRCVLIENDPESIADIERRMSLVMEGPDTRAYASMKARNRPRDDGPLFGGSEESPRHPRPTGSLRNGAEGPFGYDGKREDAAE